MLPSLEPVWTCLEQSLEKGLDLKALGRQVRGSLMDFQIATLCDYAADHQGKMTVVAPFDALAARELPVRHPSCALAMRVCMTPEDNGDHTMLISLIDEDGTAVNPQMPIKADLPVKMPDDVAFVTRNLIVNFQGLEFKKTGVYSVDITLDNELAVRIPLRVVQVDEKGQQQPA